MGSGGATRQYRRSKVPRLKWTAELHHSFIRAIDSLGGQDKATPKLILQLMDTRGLTISHVKSHLQMYRCARHDIGKEEMQPQIHLGTHSFAIDERGPKEFMCPPMKRAKVGTQGAATYKSMQGSSDMRRISGYQYCIDDYMPLQAMSMDRRKVNEGLGWQRDAAAAAAANPQELGSWVQGPEPFKIHQMSKPEAHHHLSHMARLLSSKEIYESRCFLFSSAARDEPGGGLAKKCSPLLSLAVDQKAVNGVSSWPSESSCVLSPSSRSLSDCSGPPGCSLELSLSVCGS